MLDDYGMYMTYGEAANVEEMSGSRYLPQGLVEGCRLLQDIAKDSVITYGDVVLPAGRMADRLRAEQYRKFRGETWLQDLLDGPGTRWSDDAGTAARKCSLEPSVLPLREYRHDVAGRGLGRSTEQRGNLCDSRRKWAARGAAFHAANAAVLRSALPGIQARRKDLQ